ncbi:hypothetical protein [Streptomyces sp. NPDC058694]|uniref:hypothetical protein n=1 Tax=Streptomyces sp. NPDC058694 TaxID=3346603 RepID=UPI00365AAE07
MREIRDGRDRRGRVHDQQIDQPRTPLLQLTGRVQPRLRVPGRRRGRHLVQVQEQRLTERGQHMTRQQIGVDQCVDPTPCHPRTEPQRRLERVETAPLVRLAPADALVRRRHRFPVGVGLRHPLQEPLQRVLDTLVHDLHVRVVRRPRVLRDLGSDRPYDLFGDVVEEGSEMVVQTRRERLERALGLLGPRCGVRGLDLLQNAESGHAAAPSAHGKWGTLTLPARILPSLIGD